MQTLDMEATPATVWAILQRTAVIQEENAAAQKEYAASLKESERELKESRLEIERELKESRRETERELKESRLKTERELKESRLETERELKESRLEAEREWKESRQELKESRLEIERELKESQLKTERELKESRLEAEREWKESLRTMRERSKEIDKQIEALGVRIDRVSANIGGVNNSLGDFAESLLTNDLLKKFKALNLDFDDALRNVEIRERGTKRVLAEIDCLLLNTDIALVAEVKASMTRGDVEKHLTRMKVLSGKQNGLLKEKKLYGAMAGIKIREKTKEYAKSKGLFVLEPSGDTVKIEAPAGKPAVW